MRMPWGIVHDLLPEFLQNGQSTLVGCLSFEDRCVTVPTIVSQTTPGTPCEFIEVVDPIDVMPNYNTEAKKKAAVNQQNLQAQSVNVAGSEKMELLASEDELLSIYRKIRTRSGGNSVILDVTSFPKRYFCFLMKRLLLDEDVNNVLLTYTQPGARGYFLGHLAEAPLYPDYLPGFSPSMETDRDDTLVVSVGFETQTAKTLLPIYSERNRPKLLMSFPPNGSWSRRQFRSVQTMSTVPEHVNRNDVRTVAAWDITTAYTVLRNWHSECGGGITFAPFGPKPHTIAMALLASKLNVGMLYTQPQSYRPDYSVGASETWSYLAKWDGICCHDRILN